ncbi:MAG: hypothetical protein IPL53_23780 [Ignavibacteria bacterium]|nr:hypothetical protein [Ignavibacteria bacterium]
MEVVFFSNHRADFDTLIDLTLHKEKISLIYRRSFTNVLYRIFNKQTINYKIENYNSGLQIEFDLSENFENEGTEVEKLLTDNVVKSRIRDNSISFDSALNQIDLNREDMMVIFHQMRELKIVYISKFKEDLNSVYFSIDDKYFIIFSKNVAKLNLERMVPVQKIESDWYFYEGKL